jgi:hypothetical protein
MSGHHHRRRWKAGCHRRHRRNFATGRCSWGRNFATGRCSWGPNFATVRYSWERNRVTGLRSLAPVHAMGRRSSAGWAGIAANCTAARCSAANSPDCQTFGTRRKAPAPRAAAKAVYSAPPSVARRSAPARSPTGLPDRQSGGIPRWRHWGRLRLRLRWNG